MELLWVSNALLWVLVIALATACLALARQVGLLHERIAPAGALSPRRGLQPGVSIEPESFTDLSGRPVVVGGRQAQPTLILFTSPTCPICRELLPVAKSVARHDRLRLIFASDGEDPATHQAYVRQHGLEAAPYVLSQPLGLRFGVAQLPFAVLLDAEGTLAARGLVNTREHLESLLEAMRSGVVDLQAWLAQTAGAGAPDDPHAGMARIQR